MQNIDPHGVVRTEEQEHPACPDGNEDFVKITVFQSLDRINSNS